MSKKGEVFMRVFESDNLSFQAGVAEDKEAFTIKEKGILLLGTKQHVQKQEANKGARCG